MQLLLPLALTDPAHTDLALVLDRASEGGPGGGPCYRAYAVLPLSWAYRNARLMSRPESSWLHPRGVRTAS